MKRILPRLAWVILAALPGSLGLTCPASRSPADSPFPVVPPGDVVQEGLGAAMDTFLTDLSKEGFSGAVLVADGAEVLLKKGYGLANREVEIPTTADTRYEIGTLAKIFTAAAILKLEAEGRLTLDDRVEQYTGPLEGARARATIHQLLVHTSGLVGHNDRLRYDSSAAFLRSVRAAEGAGPPGAKFRYSNAGYTLLAAIVEKASGMPFEDYLEARLFRPAGMESTGFAWDVADISALKTTGLATGYEGHFLEALTPVPPTRDIWGNRGPSSIVTTVGDLYLWIQALENGTVLPESSVEKMFTAFEGLEGYAWHVVERSNLGRLVRRGGALPAFEASVRWYRDADLAIVFAINSNMGFRIKVAKGIARILAPHVEAPR